MLVGREGPLEVAQVHHRVDLGVIDVCEQRLLDLNLRVEREKVMVVFGAGQTRWLSLSEDGRRWL